MKRLMFTPKDGELHDLGLQHYGEFITSHTTAHELLNGGMTTVDGRPGRLEIIETFENGVQLRWVCTGQYLRIHPQIRRVA